MGANTILLDFSVDPGQLAADGFEKIEKEVISALSSHFLQNLEKVTGKELSPVGDYLAVYTGPRSSIISIRTYPNGLVTVNLDYYLSEGEKPLLTIEDSRNLELAWAKSYNKVKAVKTLPRILRGIDVDTYFLTSDERLIEYDVDSVLFDEHSPFQHVQILHSNTFGNMLVLDDLQNLAESDLIYTESIMCRGAPDYDYRDKEILILGGGDGALLWELRKENPKFVTMIEIDDIVMQVCKVHLRSACGDTLDNYKGSNYEIIVGDCIDYMKTCAKAGRKFDYVFADLTDIPISQTPQGEIWDFIRLILNLSFSVIKPDGKYMTHGNGSSSPKALKMYEDQLEKLDVDVKFTRSHAFVPSFMEDWVFYQITRKNL